jgi:hypothetical protein
MSACHCETLQRAYRVPPRAKLPAGVTSRGLGDEPDAASGRRNEAIDSSDPGRPDRMFEL